MNPKRIGKSFSSRFKNKQTRDFLVPIVKSENLSRNKSDLSQREKLEMLIVSCQLNFR